MTSTPPISSFEPFPRLPIELRLKIWSSALISYPAQTFILKVVNMRKPRKHHLTTIRATAPQPTLAHVNQEARLEALAHFSQIATRTTSTDASAPNYPPDYKCALVNFSIDIFTVEKITYIFYFLPKPLKQIQLLRAKVHDYNCFGEDLSASSISRVDDLREIEFTVRQGSHSREYVEAGVERMLFFIDKARKENPHWIFPKAKIVEDGVLVRVHDGGAWVGEVQG